MYEKKRPTLSGRSFLFMESGNVLLSQVVSNQVPSALKGLTSVFGMGTGGSLRLLPPEILCARTFKTTQATIFRSSFSDVRSSSSDHPAQIIFVCFIYFSDSRSGDQPSRSSSSPQTQLSDQALGLLVSTTSIRYRTSSDDLSTSSSLRGLTCF